MFDDSSFEMNNVSKDYNLFSDDYSYQEFRQSIIDAPTLFFDKSKLPFDNIKLKNPELDIDIRLEFQFLLHSLLPETTYTDKHLFYLYKAGICRAYGYYIPSSKYFVVCEGSLVSSSVDSRYEETSSGKARVRFIREACEEYPNYYRVKKDAKCISATAAASYVLGRTARYTDWKDKNGELLSNFYPEHFVKKSSIDKSSNLSNTISSSFNEEVSNIRRFYLKMGLDSELRCYAIGEYNPISNQFILKAKSILSYDSKNISRQLFLSLYTEKNQNKKTCTLKRDVPCASIEEATTLVLGYVASDYQNLWRDIDDKSFKELFT
ncbi:MAG: DUF4357 domain-containing protein [Muribaculaceae bacterium]|nr:DUF4357 domain-containing protein [Muribaculaceae bacterium]